MKKLLLAASIFASLIHAAQEQNIPRDQIKRAYLQNLEIFEHKFSPVSEIWDKEVTLFDEVRYDKERLKNQLTKSTEIRFLKQDDRGVEETQFLSITYKCDKKEEIIVAIKPNLTDKDNNTVEFNNEPIVSPESQIMEEKPQKVLFLLKKPANSKVKGTLDVEYKLLTNKPYIQQKPAKNLAFSIDNHQFQFLEVGENYVLIKGKVEELKNLGFENLSNDKKILIAPIDFYTSNMKFELKGNAPNKEIEDQIKKEIAKRFIKPYETNLISEKFTDPSIKNMSFDAYETYYKTNFNELKNTEQVLIVNFPTKIENLYLYYNVYEDSIILQKEINERIKTN